MTDLDRIMNEDPLNLTKEDLDALIAYHRKARANFELGTKSKAKKETGPQQTINLESLGLVPKPPPMRRA